MPTNIEIKSLLKTDEYLEAIENAKKIYNGTDTFELYQKDTFFNTSNGTRLKLRCEKVIETGVTSSMLISYERPNVIGPKASLYFKTAVPDPEALELILNHSYGILGVVEKNRTVYIVERNGMKARVHIDKVTDIGEAIEFEVIIDSEDELEAGNEFADYLTKQFDIKEKNLVAGAYMDLILEEEIKAQEGSKSPESWTDVKMSTERRNCEIVKASAERFERDVAEATAKMREQEAAETLATIIKKESDANPKRARRSK